MADYLPTATFEDAIGVDLCRELTGLSGTALTTEEERLILQAEAFVNGYLEPVQTVPVTGTEAVRILAKLTHSVAQYYLYQKTRGSEIQTKVRQEYDDAVKLLERISAGKFILPGSTDTRQGSSFEVTSDDARFDWDEDAEDTF